VPDFQLVDQDGQPATLKTFAGKPWIADLIFTHCAGPCPIMTAKMAKLQREISSPQVQFVSFSVDPTRDTPEVLKEYVGRFKGDESHWKFLTGSPAVIFATGRGLLVTALPADGQNDIIHDERFILIDAHGKIRGHYHSKDEEALSRLKSDAEALAQE
jgi:protein SCO1